MRRPPIVTLFAVLTALTFAACSGSGGDEHATHGDGTSLGQPDAPIAGPQGNQAQFVVECGFSHAAQDDPIVYPGQPGASHLHLFFGNTHVDASSTAKGLVGGETTCANQADTAAYWAPALLRDGAVLDPVKSTAYYRPGLHVGPSTVVAYPPGFQMVAGNAMAEGGQPVSIVAWTCGTGIARDATPPECPQGRNLRLIVTFPDCWNGHDLDSADHHDHVAYSSGGTCPKGYPVSIPQLQFSVEYPVSGPVDGLVLASGGLNTGHADFMNGWNQQALEREIALCLHRDVVCGVASGRISG